MIRPEDVILAGERIKNYVYRTPFEKSHFLSDITGGQVFLKLECQQKVKAYKIRGAVNKILCLAPEERQKGIVTASSGNHGAVVSYVSGLLGINNVTVYVPEVTPAVKKEKIKRYGAKLVVAGKNFDEAFCLAKQKVKELGGIWIDPCSDEAVIAGQGTIGLEMLEDNAALDTLVVPIGGGGMITGISIIAKALKPGIKVVGVQTEACPAMLASLRDGRLYERYQSKPSICEALVGGVGEIPYIMAKECIDDILLVAEKTIKEAVIKLIDREKILAEPSAAVGVACLMEHCERFKGRNVGVVISGGNMDLELLEKLISEVKS
ncbi:MAG: threonine dehydratase [Tepidanaerobacteraceae bacterium]|nr:threonine dehydratase [Tepidanaerobacteraceae bacterium]